MKKYYITAGVFYALVFTSGWVHSFVLDMEYIGPEKRYELDRKCFEKENNEPFMGYEVWLLDQDRKEQDWWDWIGDQSRICFDFSYDGNPSGCNPENNERGRD